MTIGNFFIWAELDGVNDILEGGPRGDDGGFTLVIHQRDRGGVKTPVKIEGHCHNGQLELDIAVNGQRMSTYQTER